MIEAMEARTLEEFSKFLRKNKREQKGKETKVRRKAKEKKKAGMTSLALSLQLCSS
jgi:hypothetical protein